MTEPATERRFMLLRDDPMISVREASSLLAVSAPAIRAWIKRGAIRGVKIGKGYRIRRSQILKLAGITEESD